MRPKRSLRLLLRALTTATLTTVTVTTATLLCSSTTSAQASTSGQSSTQTHFDRQDDVVIPIHTESGHCPDQIRFWEEVRFYEGGVEHAVTLDIAPLARDAAQFMETQERVIIYAAPLQSEYANCSGWVDSFSEVHAENLAYNVWFQWGHVYFRFDLDYLGTADSTGISHQSIRSGRPYLRWSRAD
jgi:hypothetical protein